MGRSEGEEKGKERGEGGRGGALTPIIHIYPMKSRFGKNYDPWACNSVVKRNFRLREVFGFVAGFVDLLYTYTATCTPAGIHKYTYAHMRTNTQVYTQVHARKNILIGTCFYALYTEIFINID